MRYAAKKPLADYDLSTTQGRWNARRAGYDVPKAIHPPLPTRPFWSLVDKGDGAGCWLWTGERNNQGYGDFRFNGRHHLAHRWAYILLVSTLRADQLVCHRCDTPLCVRPDHLFVGTQQDNIRDCAAKGRNRGNTTPREWTRIITPEIWAAICARRGTMSVRAIARDLGIKYSAVLSAIQHHAIR